MKRKTSFFVYLFSVFVVICGTSTPVQQRKVEAVDTSKIFSSKIRRDEFPASVEETEMGKDDFKPSVTNLPISSSSRYAPPHKSKKVLARFRSTTKEINESENPQRKLQIVPSEEILSEPPTVIELFSAMHMNYSNNATKESSENTKKGVTKDSNRERPKVPRIYYYGAASNTHAQPQPTNHYDDSHHHTQANSGVVFPDSVNNEVSDNHFHQDPTVDHRERHNNHHHNDHSDYHAHSPGHTYGHYPYSGHGHGNHDNHFSHTPVHTSAHSGVRYEGHRDSGLSPAITKALQFWIPTALLLTGASVLFPTRVKVPTNIEDVRNNRPKRSPYHYSFTAGDGTESFAETGQPMNLRREHRQISSAEDLYDYVDDHQAFHFRESQRINKPPNHSANVPLSQEIREEQSSKLRSKQGVASQVYPTVMQQASTTPRIAFDRSIKSYPQVPKYDAFRFQKEDFQNPENSENFEAFVPQNSPKKSAAFKITTLTTPKSRPTEESKTTVRKVVFIRKRKNQTTTSTSAPVTPISLTTLLPPPPPSSISIVVSKPKPNRKLPHIKPSNSPQTKESIKTEKKYFAPNEKTKPSVTSATAQKVIPQASTTTEKALLPLLKIATKNPRKIVESASQKNPQLLQILNESIMNTVSTKSPFKDLSDLKAHKQYDLSPEGPIVGLLTSTIQYDNESDACQKRALCELAIRGTNPKATKFETFMWTLAVLVPDALTPFYDLEETFQAIRDNQCSKFQCANPNLDIQETSPSSG